MVKESDNKSFFDLLLIPDLGWHQHLMISKTKFNLNQSLLNKNFVINNNYLILNNNVK